tara:strand:- start:189 stop:1136 length:948 start_codon:yes stop_codon:yes gene_type:complete
MSKVVIIGVSKIVHFHITALREVGLEPIAIASSNPNSLTVEKFAKENNISKYYFDWKKMLNEETFDGIIIATRIESTIEILSESLKFNIPIFVEKPVGLYSKSLKKIIENAHKKILVGYNRRYYKTVKRIRELLKDEQSVLANITTPELQTNRNFFDNTAHSIDLLRFIFGELKIEFIKKIISNNKIKGVIAIFSTKSNHFVQFTGNWGASDNFSLITYLGKKKLELKPYEELNIFEEIDIIEPTDESPIRKYVPKKIQTIKLDDVDTKFKPGFFQQMTEFSEMIAKNSPPKFGSTLSDAQKTLEIYEELIGVLK